MALNIHLHQHLMGPDLMAGAHAEMEYPYLRFSTLTTASKYRLWASQYGFQGEETAPLTQVPGSAPEIRAFGFVSSAIDMTPPVFAAERRRPPPSST